MQFPNPIVSQLSVTDGLRTITISAVSPASITFYQLIGGVTTGVARLRSVGSVPTQFVIESFGWVAGTSATITFDSGTPFMDFNVDDGVGFTRLLLQGEFGSGGFPAIHAESRGFGVNTLSNIQGTAGTSTSTSYTATLTTGTACSLVFAAPASGRILVFNSASSASSAIAYNFCSFEIRIGASVGSGTVFQAAIDANALRNPDTNFHHYTSVTLVTGLTAGTTYNIRQMFKVGSGTGTWSEKELIIQPQL